MTEPPEYPPPPADPGGTPPPPPPPPPLSPYGQQPYYQQPPQKTGTNGFAIASLVFGIIGGCLLGLIFGIVALNQIKRNGQNGRGLAIAGIVLSVLWFLALVIFGIVSAMDDADRDSTGTITDPGKVSSTDLKVGDCLNDLDADSEVVDVPAVPCDQPHEGEVYAVVTMSDSAYPGDDALTKRAQSRCIKELKAFAPEAFSNRDIGVFWLQPTEFTWARGDRGLSCVATTKQKSTGSIKD